ncbi:hypothetical protein [Thermanaerosceptrum fracticalcis]|nr:hypothetical protein [Thermanaerosceptrum fracticalcis]
MVITSRGLFMVGKSHDILLQLQLLQKQYNYLKQVLQIKLH